MMKAKQELRCGGLYSSVGRILTIAKIVIILSGTYMSFVFNATGRRFYEETFPDHVGTVLLLTTCVVIVGLYLLMFQLRLLEKLHVMLASKPRILRGLLILYSLWCAFRYVSRFNLYSHFVTDYVHIPPTWVLVLPLALMYLVFMVIITEIITGLFRTSAPYERMFFIIASLIGISYIDFVFSRTTVYYGGVDLIYSYDSYPNGFLLLDPFHLWSYHQWVLSPNFALPLLQIAQPFEQRLGEHWGVLLRSILQFELLVLSIIMLARMISENHRVRLIALLIFAFSFPTLILSMITERRVMALVLLIFAIYHCIHRAKADSQDSPFALANYFMMSVASGMVVVNAYVFLLTLWTSATTTASKRVPIKPLLWGGASFVFLTAFLGKIGGLIGIKSQIDTFSGHDHINAGLGFTEKLTHYMYFAASNLIAPPSEIGSSFFLGNIAWWQSPPVMGGYFFVGTVVFAVAVLGFVLNRRDAFARIAASSVVVSICFLFIFSLNANENAIVLNTPFYAYAFVSLIIMAFDKLIGNEKAKTVLLSAIAGICLVWNVSVALKIYQFGIEHYPA
jgi:hypothetical protein